MCPHHFVLENSFWPTIGQGVGADCQEELELEMEMEMEMELELESELIGQDMRQSQDPGSNQASPSGAS